MKTGDKWMHGIEEVEEACELLNEKMYKRLAKELLQESTEREYKPGELYHCQSLYRDSHVKGLTCMVMGERMKKAIPYYEYIKLGEFVFKVFKVKTHEQHVLYKLISGPQLSLFQ